MTDDLGLPDRRELSPDELDNLLASVREGMGKPQRRRWAVAAAAAAAVVLVLAGALVATAVIRDTETGPVAAPDPDFTLDQTAAKAGLDRCWAAVQAQGKAASFPARDDWVPLFTKGGGAHDPVGVVAAMVGSKPFFCETTETTVTVSDPNATPAYAAGTKTGALLMSPNGTVAGVADPGWPVLDVTGRTAYASFASDTKVSRHGNLFVEMTQTKFSRTTVSIGPHTEERSSGAEGAYQAPHLLPAAPAPAVSITDRAVTPAPDRSSAASVAFRECVAGADEVLPDQDAYHGTTLLTEGSLRVVLARFGEKVAVCQSEPGWSGGQPYQRVFVDFGPAGPPQPARKLSSETLGGSEKTGKDGAVARTPFSGVVSRDAAQISLEFPQGMGTDAAVTDGTFAVWTPRVLSSGFDSSAVVPITVRDAAGKVLYQGTLPLY